MKSENLFMSIYIVIMNYKSLICHFNIGVNAFLKGIAYKPNKIYGVYERKQIAWEKKSAISQLLILCVLCIENHKSFKTLSIAMIMCVENGVRSADCNTINLEALL